MTARRGPWFRFESAAWLHSPTVLGFSLAAQGLAVRLLALVWENGGDDLPTDDADTLRRLVGSPDGFEEAWSEVAPAWPEFLARFRAKTAARTPAERARAHRERTPNARSTYGVRARGEERREEKKPPTRARAREVPAADEVVDLPDGGQCRMVAPRRRGFETDADYVAAFRRESGVTDLLVDRALHEWLQAVGGRVPTLAAFVGGHAPTARKVAAEFGPAGVERMIRAAIVGTADGRVSSAWYPDRARPVGAARGDRPRAIDRMTQEALEYLNGHDEGARGDGHAGPAVDGRGLPGPS